MKHIGLDVGRSGVKTYSDNGKWVYPASVGSYRNFKLDKHLTENDMIVQYNDNTYLVGEIADIEAHDGTRNFLKSKANPDTQILSVVGIHRLVNDGATVNVVICHPIDNHRGTDKTRLKSLLEGRHTVIVNGNRKTFTIDTVSVTPEGACALFAIEGLPPVAHGIDIGSATVNYATWLRGGWVDRLSGTLPYGFDNSNLSVERFARKVAMDFSRMVQDVKGQVFVFGGIAEQIVPHLSQYITNQRVVAVEDSLYVNAKSCYNIGVKLHEKNLQKK